MALMEIRIYPDPVLRKVAKPVTLFDGELERLVSDMAHTMYTSPGVGLAAPQVGLSERFFIIDITSPRRESLHVFVNPRIVHREGAITWEEGCLSFPDVRTDVDRSRFVKVEAQDVKGRAFALEAEGLMAVAIQHELDHLDGRLLIDNMSIIDRALLKRKMTRQAIDSARSG